MIHFPNSKDNPIEKFHTWNRRHACSKYLPADSKAEDYPARLKGYERSCPQVTDDNTCYRTQPLKPLSLAGSSLSESQENYTPSTILVKRKIGNDYERASDLSPQALLRFRSTDQSIPLEAALLLLRAAEYLASMQHGD